MNNDARARLRNKIRQAREARGWTQAELGKMLKYRYDNFVGVIESGKAETPLVTGSDVGASRLPQNLGTAPFSCGIRVQRGAIHHMNEMKNRFRPPVCLLRLHPGVCSAHQLDGHIRKEDPQRLAIHPPPAVVQ